MAGTDVPRDGEEAHGDAAADTPPVTDLVEPDEWMPRLRRSTFTPPGDAPVAAGEAPSRDAVPAADSSPAAAEPETVEAFPFVPETLPIDIDQIPGVTDPALDWSPVRKEPAAAAAEDDGPSANVVFQLDDVPPSEPFGLPVEPLAPAPSFDAAPLFQAPVFDLTPDPAPEPPEAVDEPPAPPLSSMSEAEQLAHLSQHAAPAGRPWVPERRSLRDDELAELVDHATEAEGGTLAAMEELERQLALRTEEKREFEDWQRSMLSVGTPEAIAAVEEVLPEFSDIVPTGAIVLPQLPAPPAPPVGVPSSTTPPPPLGAPSSVAPPPPLGAPSSAAPPPVGDPSSVTPPPPVGAPSSPAPPPPAGLPTSSTPPPVPETDETLPGADQTPWDLGEPALDAEEEAFATGAPVIDAGDPAPDEPGIDAEEPEPETDEPLLEADNLDAQETIPQPDELAFAAESFDVSEPTPVDAHVEPEEIVVEATVEPEQADVVPEPVQANVVPEPEQTDVWAAVPEPELEDATPAPEPGPPAPQPGPPALVEPPAHPSIARPDPWTVTPAAGVSDDPAVVEPTTGDLILSTGAVPIVTGAVPIPFEALDLDVDELEAEAAVDETDRVGSDVVVGPAHPETAPVLSPRIPEDEVVLAQVESERPRVFSLERAGLEPTPEEQRVGRAARSFWLWFAANSSIAGVAFGGLLFSLGTSLRQTVVGVLAGVALSFIPLGLGILAGKRSSQPTMVTSRAAFGLHGNVVPASIALLSRVFWGAALLWIAAQGVASILVGAGLDAGLDHDLIAVLATVVVLALAVTVALFGYGFIARLQLVLTIVNGLLVAGLVVLTAQYVSLGAALRHADGSWVLVATTAVLVFSFVGLLWANSSGDLARYQRAGSSGGGSMLAGAFGATLPMFVLVAYGALLAASDERIAEGLLTNPFDTLGLLLPAWYPAPLIAALVLGLVSAVTVTIYSGGFALMAIGVSLRRHLSVLVVGAAVLAAGVGLALLGTGFGDLFRDLATTIAVPVAAWVGIVAADTMIRSRPYDTDALLGRSRLYGSVNVVTLVLYVVVAAVGLGLTTASVSWLGWQGYLLPLLGVPLDSVLAGSDLGVLVALVLGLLVPITTGVPAIRRQQAPARRTDPVA